VSRVAIFTEGETEQLFVEWLVRELAGAVPLQIEMLARRGESSVRRRLRIVRSGTEPPPQFYFLIVDCGSDGGVKSRIIEEYDNLVRTGYSSIVGLRDAPKVRANIPRLRTELLKDVNQVPASVVFVLAIMEIESWFLSEHTHFERIHEGLTPVLIQQSLGFDPRNDDMRLRDRPASDLNEAYQLVGKHYHKGQGAQQTVFVLDCAPLAYSTVDPDLQSLVSQIERGLT
jgi:hypothetical protein